MTFRTRLFLSSILVTALTLAVATALVSWNLRRNVSERIERALVDEARLAAETLSHRRAATLADLDAEADAIGQLLAERVTFISADGRVVGDSEVPLAQMPSLENHADRPEVQQARGAGLGIARRYSATVGADMLYVAVPVRNPQMPDVAFVRLAVPLVDIEQDVRTVRRGAIFAFLVGLLAALGLAFFASTLLARRVRAIAAVAERYASGNFAPPARHYGDDEIGSVARVLDDTIQELARRMTELNADRARMAAILGGMVEGVLVVDGGGRLQLVNEAAARMLRLEVEWRDRHYLEVVRHPDVAAQITSALAGAATAGSEVTLPRDPAVTLMARAAPIASGADRGAVLVLHDITALRRVDMVRRDFVANVSHELRTPLTSIRGYVEALQDDQSAGPRTRQFLDTIARHTARMERLVRDLLRLARLEAGQEPLDRAPIDVRALFDGVVTELSTTLDARGQSVELDIAADATGLSADATKLHDALRNLLENASRHAPAGSRIRMSSARRDGRLALIVSDEGPGIPDADLSRVFERFYRVDKGRSRQDADGGGTGLGLSIVRHLVELHGGRVSAANRPGGGAMFTIEVPAGDQGATVSATSL